MKARSEVKLDGVAVDEVAFEKMKRILPGLLNAHRDRQQTNLGVRALPEEIAFKLTNRCNLRCKHCYQWNEDGHHHDLSKAEQKREMDFAIIRKVFDATRELKSNVYLWGGEPMIYGRWDDLVDLLEADPRWTTMCTNGIGLDKRLPSLLRISDHFEALIALEGFEEEHDAIRGKSTFGRTMAGIDLLLEHKRRGEYRGEIAVNCVITGPMVSKLSALTEFLEAKGLDSIYLSFPWFLSDATSAKMDEYYGRQFNWLCSEHETARFSWHAYKYQLSPSLKDQLIAELERVNRRSWKIKVRYNPELAFEEIEEFLSGSDRPAQGKTRCTAIKNRMDVFPNGEVISCKFFPEFSVGNLTEQSVEDIWHGDTFQHVRQTIDQGLMPVCSKCNLLYSRGI